MLVLLSAAIIGFRMSCESNSVLHPDPTNRPLNAESLSPDVGHEDHLDGFAIVTSFIVRHTRDKVEQPWLSSPVQGSRFHASKCSGLYQSGA